LDGKPEAGSGSAQSFPTGASAGEPSLLATGERLLAAGRGFAVALAALFAAEAQLLKQRLGLVFLAGVALVAFAVSLWACAVALIGWAFRVATGSTGAALGLLVVLHVILVAASWWSIKRGIHAAGFPGTRGELAALQRGLRRRAAASGPPSTAPEKGNDTAHG
jgi:uncharacterized membrane protein YqjE